MVAIVLWSCAPAWGQDSRAGAQSHAEIAGAALAAGHPDEAAALAATCQDADDRCALVLARALVVLQRPAEAARALAARAERLGHLQTYAQALLGESLLLAGDGKAALGPLARAAELDQHGPAGTRAAALVPDALLASGQPAEAVHAVARALLLRSLTADQKEGLASARTTALARLAIGKSASKAAIAAAARAARELWLKFPAHPAADRARLDEAALNKRLARKLAPPSGSELLGRASRLLSAGLPAAAVEATREAAAALPSGDAEANWLLARTLAAAGLRSKAAGPLQIAWTRGGQRTAPPAGLLLARDRARRGDWQRAVALLDELARRYPKSAEAPEARLLAARLAEEHEQPAAARRRLESLAKAGAGPRQADARWLLAWLAYRAGQADASERFQGYAKLALSNTEKARGLYWAARAGAADAGALLDQTAALEPLGYYGALALAARDRAGVDLPAFPPAREAETAAAREGEDARLGLARELSSLGLCTESSAELDAYLHAHRGTAAALPALPLFERCRRFDRSLSLALSLLGDESQPGHAALLRFAYPPAYAEAVERSARRTRLDPYLLLSIARRESLFRSDVHSAAGAVGLVQLLPKTAARICAVLGRPAPDAAALADPAVALDLGAWYLSDLLGAFGDPAVAAAAYNAGPQVVRKWVAAAQGRPVDEWVEEIPYRETRLYVRYVIGAWSAYRLLAGGKAPLLGQKIAAPKSGVAF